MCTCHPSYTGGIARRIEVQAGWSKTKRLCLKTTKSRKGWALVAHTCILATWEDEIGRIVVQDQPVQIVCGTPSSQ
jgi:hypothetical protein